MYKMQRCGGECRLTKQVLSYKASLNGMDTNLGKRFLTKLEKFKRKSVKSTQTRVCVKKMMRVNEAK